MNNCKKIITHSKYNKLISKDKTTPRRCWLTAKTHKPYSNLKDLKFRRIISYSNSPSQNLEKKLIQILNEFKSKMDGYEFTFNL